jgi:AcrR family transcriptional regulator
MTKRGRGRPRREGADEQILAIAVELLREKGYRDLTVDAVAERAGVAKTTVYRRWASKGALVAAAITPLALPETDVPLVMLRDITAILRLIGSADEDAGMLDVVRAALEPRREALIDTLRSHTNPAFLADAMIGSLLMRVLVTREPLTDELPAEILRHHLKGEESCPQSSPRKTR